MSYDIYNLPPKYQVPVLLYGTRKRDFPLEYDATHFIVEEHYLVKAGYYAQQARNTPNALYSTACLVEETIEREEGDGVWFKREYSTVPATLVEYTTGSATFPGLLSLRAPMPSRTITVRRNVNYYLIGSGGAFSTVDGASFSKQTTLNSGGYEIGYIFSGSTITADQFTVTTGGSNPGITQTTETVGGWISNSMGINSSTSGALTAYLALLSADLTQSSYSIVAAATVPTRYRGNIWQYETLYAKAL
jgi:hypothetical protein